MLYGVHSQTSENPDGELYTINTITGLSTLVGPIDFDNIKSLSWVQSIGSPAEPSPVPEPSTMLLLSTGLVGLAGWGRRKFNLM